MNIWIERGVLVLGGIAAGAIVTHILEKRRFIALELKTSESIERLYAEAKEKNTGVNELRFGDQVLHVGVAGVGFSESERVAIARELDKKYGEKNPYEMIVEDIEKTLDMSIPGDEEEVDEADIPYFDEDEDNQDYIDERDDEDDAEADEEDEEDEDSVPFDTIDPENTVAEVGPNGKEWKLNRADKRIFVISLDEFMSNDNYQQSEILYSPSRQMFFDNESEPIDDIEMYIGKGNLFWGMQSGDKNIVYIRNKDLRTDFEVIRENEEE